jgi:flagellar hook-associated protein 1 FlgK
MDEFVRVFARAFNEGIVDTNGDGNLDKVNGHVDGYALNSQPGDPPAGIRFFTRMDEYGKPINSANFAVNAGTAVDDPLTPDTNEYYDAMYQQITARNFSLSSEVFNNPSNNIAASARPGEVGNIENLRSIMGMRHNSYMFIEGGPEDFVKTIVSGMGVDGQQAKAQLANQNIMTGQIDNRRQSNSGVSIDEEMSNLVRYQHAYNAAAKMIQTYSELLDILVNRLGI